MCAERWHRNFDALSQRHTVYALDLFGFGFSGDPSFKGQLPQNIHRRQVLAFCRELSLDRVTLIGSSYGALIACLVALETPNLVVRLVLVGSGSVSLPPAEREQSFLRARASGMRALEPARVSAVGRRLETDPRWASSQVALRAVLKANALPGRIETTRAIYEGLQRALHEPAVQVFHRLQEIRQPKLFITGRDDPLASWKRAEEAAARMPDCGLLVYDHCGHAPMHDHPDRFNSDVLHFLAGAPD
jgi:4,5:9,10-diseco-3-hydroxy-5,9,17-trioxoandrosta-1(10),2-diene-4-oate hydrolase